MQEANRRPSVSYPLLLLTVALGSIVAPLNSTMLAVALPDIRDDFGVGHSEVAWLVSAYLIAMAVAQPVGGRIGDQLGRARTFRAGMVAFLGFSLAAAVAPSFISLVILRTGQALVGAAIIPNGTAMLRSAVSERRLGEAAGISGTAIGLSAAIGPLLGALMLSAGSWRWLFLMNLPLIIFGLVSLQLLRFHDAPRVKRLGIDIFGVATLTGLLVAVTILLGSGRGSGAAVFAAALAAFIVLAGAFFISQRRSATPVAEWSLFRIASFRASTVFIMLSNLVMYTTLLAIPFFIKEVQHKSDSTAGTLLGFMSLLMAFLAALVGRFSDRRGRRMPAVAGGCFQVLASVMLAVGLETGVSYAYLALSLTVMGLGVGLGTGPATTASVESAPRELAGIAAGTNSMMRYLGSIVGAAILGGILNTQGEAPGIEVFRALFVIVTVIGVLSTLSALSIHRFHQPATSPAAAATTAT